VVAGAKATAAVPVPPGWVTWMVLPDTDAICPATWSLPIGPGPGAGAAVAEVAVGATVPGVDEAAVDPLFDDPQAATESPAIPIAARSLYRTIVVLRSRVVCRRLHDWRQNWGSAFIPT
jgi:hypothetical protein